MPRSLALLITLLLGLAASWFDPAEPDPKQDFPPRKFRQPQIEKTRPAAFPHRIWAACDFEGRTPDFDWFGSPETRNIPRYPVNFAAFGFREMPHRTSSALMTGIKPVPGPKMGKVNKFYLRYYLKGATRAAFQYFTSSIECRSLTGNYLDATGLTEGKWAELTGTFYGDMPGFPFNADDRLEDFKVLVDKPIYGKDYELYLDDLIFFSVEPDLPVEKEPFPNRVIFLAAFDTGTDPKSKEKYWPGDFKILHRNLPADSYWGVAQAVPRKDANEKWIRLEIKPPRPVGERTKLRFRYHLTGASAMTVQIFDATDQDNRHIHLKDLKQGVWEWANLDFTADGKRNDGKQTPFAAGHKVDDLFFFVKPANQEPVNLLIEEVVLYDAGGRKAE